MHSVLISGLPFACVWNDLLVGLYCAPTQKVCGLSIYRTCATDWTAAPKHDGNPAFHLSAPAKVTEAPVQRSISGAQEPLTFYVCISEHSTYLGQPIGLRNAEPQLVQYLLLRSMLCVPYGTGLKREAQVPSYLRPKMAPRGPAPPKAPHPGCRITMYRWTRKSQYCVTSPHLLTPRIRTPGNINTFYHYIPQYSSLFPSSSTSC